MVVRGGGRDPGVLLKTRDGRTKSHLDHLRLKVQCNLMSMPYRRYHTRPNMQRKKKGSGDFPVNVKISMS